MTENTNSGNNANYYTGSGPYPIDSGLYYTTRRASSELSEGPYNTFDQGGNVYEWNEAIIGSDRGRRGGSFQPSYSNLRADFRSSYAPTRRRLLPRVSSFRDSRASIRDSGHRRHRDAASAHARERRGRQLSLMNGGFKSGKHQQTGVPRCSGVIMCDARNLIRPCPECDHGTVVLFTSIQRCRKCRGTGFVADDSLAIPIASLPTSVRLRNSLAKSGIKTLGHLACVAALDVSKTGRREGRLPKRKQSSFCSSMVSGSEVIPNGSQREST